MGDEEAEFTMGSEGLLHLCVLVWYPTLSLTQSPSSPLSQCHKQSLDFESGIVLPQWALPFPPFPDSGLVTGESLTTVACSLLLCNCEVVISSLTPALDQLLQPRLIYRRAK